MTRRSERSEWSALGDCSQELSGTSSLLDISAASYRERSVATE